MYLVFVCNVLLISIFGVCFVPVCVLCVVTHMHLMLRRLVKKQMAFMLARQAHFLSLNDDALNDIVNNTKQSEYFLLLARELDVMDAKVILILFDLYIFYIL